MNNKHFFVDFDDFDDLFFVVDNLFKPTRKEEKTCEKHCKCGEKKDDKNKEYFHRVEKDYVNGKCVRSREKEIVDGEVTIDKDFSTKIENNTEKESLDACNCGKCVKEAAPVTLKLQQLENYVNDIDIKIKEVLEKNVKLQSELKKTIEENNRLKSTEVQEKNVELQSELKKTIEENNRLKSNIANFLEKLPKNIF